MAVMFGLTLVSPPGRKAYFFLGSWLCTEVGSHLFSLSNLCREDPGAPLHFCKYTEAW